MTIFYHGTPITPARHFADLAGRHFCVSFADKRDINRAHEYGSGVMIDNGAFSIWKRGISVDWKAYYTWLEPYLEYHTTWAIIPDVIDGEHSDNAQLRRQWPHGQRGAPVWHMHEDIRVLLYLAEHWQRVCIGSSTQYRNVGSLLWRRRMNVAMHHLCGDGPPPCWLHMLRGGKLAGSHFPFTSVDSTNLARNFKGSISGNQRPRCIREMAHDLGSRHNPARWVTPQGAELLQ